MFRAGLLAGEMFRVLGTPKGHEVSENIMKNSLGFCFCFLLILEFNVFVFPVKQKILHTCLLAFILTSATICLILLF